MPQRKLRDEKFSDSGIRCQLWSSLFAQHLWGAGESFLKQVRQSQPQSRGNAAQDPDTGIRLPALKLTKKARCRTCRLPKLPQGHSPQGPKLKNPCAKVSLRNVSYTVHNKTFD
jgi:hypothetical protein